ncbi:MAG TPA: hypothetical protein VLW06_05280 [Terriglobales bacterium]|nr:hypothetical protein [Terriglobales bacterium]
MFKRFVAASAIAAILVPVAVIVLTMVAGPQFPRAWPLLTLWCFVPFAWGFWAMLTPREWFPERVPLWGAILGLVLSSFGAFVLDIPARIFETPISVAGSAVLVAAITALYYFVWMIIRSAYAKLVAVPPEMGAASTPPAAMKKAA